METLEERLAPANLTPPPVLQSQNGVLKATLTMSQGTAVVDGQTVTNAFTYNGSIPGPTLMVKPGDLMDITLVNNLTEMTNLHVHGLHVSPEGDSDNVLLELEPGESNEFKIQIPADHPQGLYWYHPHMHGFVNEQIFAGLSGLIVIGRPDGGAPELNGLTQQLLGVRNMNIANGAILPVSQENAATAIFPINGQLNPTITMGSGENQVWNVANIGNDGYIDVQLQGHQLFIVAQDGNPYTTVTPVNDLVIAPGKRFSFVVQGGAPGTYLLQSKGFYDGFNSWQPTTLATLTVNGPATLPPAVPSKLTPPANYFSDKTNAPIAQTRTFVWSQGPNSQGQFIFTIDGQQFPNAPVPQPRLNTVEEWILINDSKDIHPFHIHVNPFQIMSVNGIPLSVSGTPLTIGNMSFNPTTQTYQSETFVGGSDTDTVDIPAADPATGKPGELIVRMEFKDFLGQYVFHCHRVGHEDLGMMSLVQIMPEQPILVTGALAGGGPQVNVYDGATNKLLSQFFAFDQGFTGGVTVTTGDVNGDGVSDVICGAGPGGGPSIRVVSGKDGSTLYNFFAFDQGFSGGVTVTSGYIDGDDKEDIIVGAGPGGGPQVKVFSGADGHLIKQFFAFDQGFTGGVTVASDDVDGNGRYEIVAGAGAGGGPQVRVYDRDGNLMSSFFAFDQGFTGGVTVGTGRVRGFGFPGIVVGAGPGGGPSVNTYQDPNAGSHTGGDMTFTLLSSFFAYDQGFTGGVRVGSSSKATGANFVTGAGPGGGPSVGVFDGLTTKSLDSFFALNQGFTGGIDVSAN